MEASLVSDFLLISCSDTVVRTVALLVTSDAKRAVTSHQKDIRLKFCCAVSNRDTTIDNILRKYNIIYGTTYKLTKWILVRQEVGHYGLGYIRARAGSRCARISGTYT